MMRYHYIPLIGALVFAPVAIAQTHLGHTLSNGEKNFATQLEKKHHVPAKDTKKWLSQAHIQKRAIKTMKHPAESSSWKRYQRIFITDKRISDGVSYWKTHQATLKKAEQTFQVPAPLIVAIIGVESNYGRRREPYLALDTLDTLAFYGETRRQTFFQHELTDFFLLCYQLNLKPNSVRSSYAGAIGYPQFMPSSYRRIAYSHDPKTAADLMHNHDDAIMSVGNYFHHSHWHMHDPIADPETADSNVSHLVVLDKKDNNSRWLVHPNFYAIMTYNHSHLYAMTVALLAQRIKRAYHDSNHTGQHQHATRRRPNHRSQIRL